MLLKAEECFGMRFFSVVMEVLNVNKGARLIAKFELISKEENQDIMQC